MGNAEVLLPHSSLYLSNGTCGVICGSSSAFDISTNLSVMAWVKVPDDGDRKCIVSKFDYGTSEDAKQCWVLFAQDDYFYIYLEDSDSSISYYRTNDVIDATAIWQHVAFTWDYATSSLGLYINGVSNVGSQLLNSADGYLKTSSDVNLGIGFEYDSDDSPSFGDDSLTGYIHDVRIYNATLTDAQITKVMNYSNEYDDNLVGYWKMDDGLSRTSPSTVKDYKGSNDGFISGTKSITWHWDSFKGFDFWCTRWDEGNWDVTLEGFVNRNIRDYLFNAVTPGAERELYNILGTPHYIDTTYSSSNTLIFYPLSGTGLSGLREQRMISVKNISDTFINKDYFNVKIEGHRLDI